MDKCKYCQISTLDNDLENEDIRDFYNKDSQTLSVWEWGDSELITEPMLLFTDKKKGMHFGSFLINYCPMCGRKLGEPDDKSSYKKRQA